MASIDMQQTQAPAEVESSGWRSIRMQHVLIGRTAATLVLAAGLWSS